MRKEKGETFAIDFAALQRVASQFADWCVDSGVGGLTVLETVLNYDGHHNERVSGSGWCTDFQNERFIYLGDQANMPYGNYAAAGKADFLRELILNDAIFLLGQRYWPSRDATAPVFDKPPVKAIVIACNTPLLTAWKTFDRRLPSGTFHTCYRCCGGRSRFVCSRFSGE